MSGFSSSSSLLNRFESASPNPSLSEEASLSSRTLLVLVIFLTSALGLISFPRVPRGDPLFGFFRTGSGTSSSAVNANGSSSLWTSLIPLFLVLAMAFRARLNIDRGGTGALE